MRWDAPRTLWEETVSDFGWQEQGKDPTIGFFAFLLLAQVTLWTVLPALTQPNPPAETLKLLTAGDNWAWGYESVPPLGVWLARGATQLTAPAVWPVYLLSQLCSAVSIWCAWILARQFLHPWTALCAALALMAAFALTVSASEFSSGQVAQCCWTLSILAFHTALTHQRRRYWVATGFCLGLGILASYGTVLLMLAMFAFTAWDSRARKCWDSSWPFLAAFALAVVVLPHALWLANHQFVTIWRNVAAASSVADHLVQPLSFLGLQLLTMIPPLLVLAPLIVHFSFEETTDNSDDDREFTRRYLLWMTCLPPTVIFCLALIAGPSSGMFATASVWSYVGLVILMWSHLKEDRIPWRKAVLRTGAAGGILAALLIGLNFMWPQVARSGNDIHFPGPQLAEQIHTVWRQTGAPGQIPVLAGPASLIQNVGWYSASDARPGLSLDTDLSSNTMNAEHQLAQQGGLLLWNADATEGTSLPAPLASRFPGVTILPALSVPWQSRGGLQPLKVGLAMVPPPRSQAGVSPAVPSTFIPAAVQAPASAPSTASFSTEEIVPPMSLLDQPAQSLVPTQPLQSTPAVNFSAPLQNSPAANVTAPGTLTWPPSGALVGPTETPSNATNSQWSAPALPNSTSPQNNVSQPQTMPSSETLSPAGLSPSRVIAEPEAPKWNWNPQ